MSRCVEDIRILESSNQVPISFRQGVGYRDLEGMYRVVDDGLSRSCVRMIKEKTWTTNNSKKHEP